MRKFVSYIIQVVGGFVVAVGAWNAIHQAKIFWPVLIGAGIYFAGWWLRHKAPKV